MYNNGYVFFFCLTSFLPSIYSKFIIIVNLKEKKKNKKLFIASEREAKIIIGIFIFNSKLARFLIIEKKLYFLLFINENIILDTLSLLRYTY